MSCSECCLSYCGDIIVREGYAALPKEVKVALSILAGLALLMGGILGLAGIFPMDRLTAGCLLVVPGALFIILGLV